MENLEKDFLGIKNIVTYAKEEKETYISFVEGEDKMEIYTASNTMLTRLKALVRDNPEHYVVKRIYDYDKKSKTASGVEVITSKDLLTLRNFREKREISEERRAELAERMRIMRKAISTKSE